MLRPKLLPSIQEGFEDFEGLQFWVLDRRLIFYTNYEFKIYGVRSAKFVKLCLVLDERLTEHYKICFVPELNPSNLKTVRTPNCISTRLTTLMLDLLTVNARYQVITIS